MIAVRELGLQPYEKVLGEMKTYTANRTRSTPDELWLVEHPPVFTQGRAGRPEHILQTSNIPIIQTDRGGQVTYHGPGQAVVYFLVDLRRRKIGPRQLVMIIEQAMINTLATLEIHAERKTGAPGIYVQGAKIGAIGLRIKQGRSYHGLSLNVAMDLEPFSHINPCGYENLAITQVSDWAPATLPEISEILLGTLQDLL